MVISRLLAFVLALGALQGAWAQAAGPARRELAPTQQTPYQHGPLEEFEVERLRVLGIARDAAGPYARVRAPGGKVYEVRAGDYVGTGYGLVTAVRADGVVFKQLLNLAGGGDKDWFETGGLMELKPDRRADPRWEQWQRAGFAAFKKSDQPGSMKAYNEALRLALDHGVRDPRVGRTYEDIGLAFLNAGNAAGEKAMLRALSVYRNGFSADRAGVARVQKTMREFYAIFKAPPEYVRDALDREPPQ